MSSRNAKKTMMMMSSWYAKKTMMMISSWYAKKTMMMMSSWYAKKTMMMSLRILEKTFLGLVLIRYHCFIIAFCWIRSPVIKVIFAVFVFLRTPRLHFAHQNCSLNMKGFQIFVKNRIRLILLLYQSRLMVVLYMNLRTCVLRVKGPLMIHVSGAVVMLMEHVLKHLMWQTLVYVT